MMTVISFGAILLVMLGLYKLGQKSEREAGAKEKAEELEAANHKTVKDYEAERSLNEKISALPDSELIDFSARLHERRKKK